MKIALLISCFTLVVPARALISTDKADAKTAEGWTAEGFPVDDYLPWNLQFEAKTIGSKDGKYLVIFGYVVATRNSIILFPNEEISTSGRLDGSLILESNDSPAMRWLFKDTLAEGYYAVGGVFVRTPNGPAMGHMTKIRFAMKQTEAGHPAEPTRSPRSSP